MYHDTQRYLQLYYLHVCPFDLLAQWLFPGISENAAPRNHREVSISMTREDGKEIYRRYQTFTSQFSEWLVSQRPTPHKFDIGAVYNKPMEARDNFVSPQGSVGFYPIAREFILDIDMDDYDSIRTCCQGKKVCRVCWVFLAAAATLLDQTLRRDADFTELLWIFSGRRGIHCWVTDVPAKLMSVETRSALAQYLVLAPRIDHDTFNNFNFEGRYESRAVEVLQPFWLRVLSEQNLFFDDAKGEIIRQKLFDDLHHLIPSIDIKQMAERLRFGNTQCWGKSGDFWTQLGIAVQDTAGTKGSRALEFLMVAMMQPRLDINVSKEMGHLLKAPYCIHQGSGKLCQPLDIQTEVPTFDPEAAPTLVELLRAKKIPDMRLPEVQELSAAEGAAGRAFDRSLDVVKRLIKVQRDNRSRT